MAEGEKINKILEKFQEKEKQRGNYQGPRGEKRGVIEKIHMCVHDAKRQRAEINKLIRNK
jgi:hypothetical protein